MSAGFRGPNGDNFTNAAATVQVSPSGQAAILHRIIVNSSTSGTATMRNGGTAGITVTNALVLTAGESIEIGLRFSNGIHFTLGGTADVTFVWS